MLLPLPAAIAAEVARDFVGRTAELGLGDDLVAAAPEKDRLTTLWIFGEPGAGKTRLAAQIAMKAHSAGGVVLFGRCNEDVSGPYQPFVEALQWYVSCIPDAELVDRLGNCPAELIRLAPDIADRLPALAAAGLTSPGLEQHRFFEAVRTWLAASGAGKPVVFVLVPAEPASGETPNGRRPHVARSAEPSRVIVVCT